MTDQPKKDLPKLTGRDYAVGGLIIFGVVGAWFLAAATLMGFTDPGLALSAVVVVFFIVYLMLKRHRPKP